MKISDNENAKLFFNTKHIINTGHDDDLDTHSLMHRVDIGEIATHIGNNCTQIDIDTLNMLYNDLFDSNHPKNEINTT